MYELYGLNFSKLGCSHHLSARLFAHLKPKPSHHDLLTSLKRLLRVRALCLYSKPITDNIIVGSPIPNPTPNAIFSLVANPF
jgi:hypothetical protein